MVNETEFYKELSKIKSQSRFTVYLEKNGLYEERDQMIRMSASLGSACYCPITAVASMLGHSYSKATEWESAARDLDLDLVFAFEVVRAADQIEFYNPKTRSKLLLSLGLQV